MCRPPCSVPVTLITVLGLTTSKGIFASYFYPCIAVISNLQSQESQRKKKKAVFYTIIKFFMQRIENRYQRNQYTILKIYNYEYFLFSVKLCYKENCFKVNERESYNCQLTELKHQFLVLSRQKLHILSYSRQMS